MRDVFFWIAVLSCASGQAMIIRSTLRARAHAAHATAPAGVARPRPAAELAWTLLPALALAATLTVTWRAMQGDPAMMIMPNVPAAPHAPPPAPR